MMSYVLWAIGIAAVVAVYSSDRIRTVTHEIWDKYFLNVLRLGWPYALIFAIYDTISSGSLGKTVRIIMSGY
jgi:hypothetical protein